MANNNTSLLEQFRNGDLSAFEEQKSVSGQNQFPQRQYVPDPQQEMYNNMTGKAFWQDNQNKQPQYQYQPQQTQYNQNYQQQQNYQYNNFQNNPQTYNQQYNQNYQQDQQYQYDYDDRQNQIEQEFYNDKWGAQNQRERGTNAAFQKQVSLKNPQTDQFPQQQQPLADPPYQKQQSLGANMIPQDSSVSIDQDIHYTQQKITQNFRELLQEGSMSHFREIWAMKKVDPPKIEVCEPQLKSSAGIKHHVYKLRGCDQYGEFEVFRRYREFDMLRDFFQHRFYGLYVPPMPPKKKIGAKDSTYVEIRMHFLDKFMKQIANLPYLYESQEFQTFIRPNMELEKAIKAIPPMTTDELIIRYRNVMPVNELAGELMLKNYNEIIQEFVKECKDTIPQLKAFKKQIKAVVPQKQIELQFYKGLVDFLVKYEETNTKSAQPIGKTTIEDQNVTLLIGEGKKVNLKEKLELLTEQMTNPFKHVRNWMKGEVMKLKALLEIIAAKEGIEGKKINAMKALKDKKVSIDKMNQGKVTWGTLLKSTSGKASEIQKCLSQIQQLEKDIINYDIIKNFLTIYLAEIALPCFRNNKMKEYLMAMTHFSMEEIMNSQRHQDTWTAFLESIKIIEFK